MNVFSRNRVSSSSAAGQETAPSTSLGLTAQRKAPSIRPPPARAPTSLCDGGSLREAAHRSSCPLTQAGRSERLRKILWSWLYRSLFGVASKLSIPAAIQQNTSRGCSCRALYRPAQNSDLDRRPATVSLQAPSIAGRGFFSLSQGAGGLCGVGWGRPGQRQVVLCARQYRWLAANGSVRKLPWGRIVMHSSFGTGYPHPEFYTSGSYGFYWQVLVRSTYLYVLACQCLMIGYKRVYATCYFFRVVTSLYIVVRTSTYFS